MPYKTNLRWWPWPHRQQPPSLFVHLPLGSSSRQSWNVQLLQPHHLWDLVKIRQISLNSSQSIAAGSSWDSHWFVSMQSYEGYLKPVTIPVCMQDQGLVLVAHLCGAQHPRTYSCWRNWHRRIERLRCTPHIDRSFVIEHKIIRNASDLWNRTEG